MLNYYEAKIKFTRHENHNPPRYPGRPGAGAQLANALTNDLRSVQMDHHLSVEYKSIVLAIGPAMRKLHDTRALIVDLRNNHGG